MHTIISRKKNWFVVNAQLSVLEVASKVVKSMEPIISNLNASFAVQLLSGSVGVILIFVSLVIKNNVLETMFQGNPEISSRSPWSQKMSSQNITST
jgi:hypothetical protein